MSDTTVNPNAPLVHPNPPTVSVQPVASVQTDEEKEAAAAALESKKAADAAKAAADAEKSKQKSAHVVSIDGGKADLGIANRTGKDGTPIPRDGPLTIVLVETSNPTGINHPGLDIYCVARLPEKAEIGDVVEVYCVPGLNGSSAFVHPPKKESIGTLPVSTGDNTGTGVEVAANAGRSFRKVSTTAWQVLGG